MQLTVQLDNAGGFVWPGQTFSGNVVANSTGNTTKGILFEFMGIVETNWTESQYVSVTTYRRSSRGGRRREHTSHLVSYNYSAYKVLFKNAYYLVGDGTNVIQLLPGQSVYPFHFVLPPHLPASFSGVHGYIGYMIKLTEIRPILWNLSQEVRVNVACKADLNNTPQFKNRVDFENGKEFGFCGCFGKSGTLHLQVSLSREAFSLGETIYVNATVHNKSTRKILRIDAILDQVVSFYGVRGMMTQGGYHYIEPYEIERHFPPIMTKYERIPCSAASYNEPITKHMQQSIQMALPVPLNTACSWNTGLIDIMYEITVTVVPKGCCTFSMETKVPVVIGNVPFSA